MIRGARAIRISGYEFRREPIARFGQESLTPISPQVVGTLVEIGQGLRTLQSFKDLLEAGDRTKAGITAPPHGLYLAEVRY